MNDAPVSYRTLSQLIPGDWFTLNGLQYVVLGDGFEHLRDNPDTVIAAELGLGALQAFKTTDEVVWIKKSRAAVRDWDEERGRK